MEGTPFGRYRLQDLLGRGGMGEVWRAYDTETQRVVAVKVLPSHFAEDDMFQQRFRREAQTAARLTEPHVVPIHTYGEIDGRLFVDMRLIEGDDLQTLLAAGPMNPARAVVIIEQVAAALSAAHKVGLVHRDVKPSNILIAEYDFAYLIDFGIARGSDHTSLTGTNQAIGTWFYMAPERFNTGHVDARSDTYALACVLYECLTASRPFPGADLAQQITAHMSTPPPRPSIATRGVPAAFDEVVATGMAKNPHERYGTTIELARAARAAITTPMPQPVPPRQPPPPFRRPPRPGPSATATDAPAHPGTADHRRCHGGSPTGRSRCCVGVQRKSQQLLRRRARWRRHHISGMAQFVVRRCVDRAVSAGLRQCHQ